MVDGPLKWHGGKAYIASKIVAMMPPHIHYVEPYAGGLSVLLAKNPEGVSEVVNDISQGLTNFWQVLQQPSTLMQFYCRVANTPFSEKEWQIAFSDDGPWVDRCVTSACTFFIKRKCALGKAVRYTDFCEGVV